MRAQVSAEQEGKILWKMFDAFYILKNSFPCFLQGDLDSGMIVDFPSRG